MRWILFSIGGFNFYSYGFMIAIGVIAAFVVAEKRAEKYECDPDVVYKLGMTAVVGGFIGAKLLYVLLNFNEVIHSKDIIGTLSSGFVVYGGIIAGVLVGYVYCKKKGYSVLKYFDLLLPSVALAQGFGRIGCLMAGCCYGEETHSVLGIVFHDSPHAPNGVKLFPSQIFSSIGNFVNCAILIYVARKTKDKKKAGLVTSLYLIIYSVMRFIIEFFRGDEERGSVGFLSTSQFIAIFMLLVGVIVYVMTQKRNKDQIKSDK